MAGGSVARAQQVASPVTRLDNRKLNLLADGLDLPDHIRTMEDLSAYAEIPVERLNPYVDVVDNEPSGRRLHLTQSGQQEFEQRKRSRHHFVHRPAASVVRLASVRFEKLKIEENASENRQPPEQR